MSVLHDLALVFGQLGLAAVGGGNTVLPEMQRQVVQVHGWMSAREFAALYALAQAAPGPNMMVTTLIGYRVAGVPGALTATFAMIGPPAVLAYSVAFAWQRFRERAWRMRLQEAITPIVVGLVASGATLLSLSTAVGPVAVAVTLVSAMVLSATDVSPLWLLGLGGLFGMLGLV